MKPQNQVTVRSEETGEVFRIGRKVAERHDGLTILDDAHPEQAVSESLARGLAEAFSGQSSIRDDLLEEDAIGGFVVYDPASVDPEWVVNPIQSAKPVDPIAAPVADDN